ncbi:MAG: Site-specific recombinase XerD [Candidatus Midichloria mitochondrii]|uniref:Tyrosine recombinase XerC n=1 Tax=Midichloria mitochondrii (strain IricVA) TaxID=696127 RepID=F7XTT4_MIDMI|nr:tyrosine recombinase [Candidatus Midichloria mitochondrii]AEI89293.1 tyrosine recombinase XerD [Candidatus Midichloria mitochondrii IricVA]MDJ1256380.1 tyrosine recombinase [Candidatus Midichloria mitochondrii]MDJ1288072.1 tyrosine recombinase [Candidatus Midichloria mitochondrii]MDJ1298910.1 tyrosine recombinase [Candidatus Midichloria mitochondrii]MDJ1313061.1 tyrosine recombinase [Candidatus Midichloria mitochondrii]
MIRYGRALENFLEMLAAERSVAQNTVYAYKNDIEKLLEHTASLQLKLDEINLKILEDYLAKLKLNQGIGPKTISRKISSIRQFFDFLTSEGLVKNNIAVDLVMPKKSIDLPKAVSRNEIDMLLQYAYNISTFEGIRTATMLELLYATGMRISELLTLKLQSLQNSPKSSANYVIVKGKGGKERIVLLNEYAKEALAKYLEIREAFIKRGTKTDWLFPSFNKAGKVTHLTRQRFGQVLKEVAINAGVNPNIISPHKIRHSFATHMLQNGANLRIVQELLGHSDISSTQIYTKVSNEQAAKLVLQKHPLKDS